MSQKSDMKRMKKLAYEIEERIDLHNKLALKYTYPIIGAVYVDKEEEVYKEYEKLIIEREEANAESQGVVEEG
jgi:hypothetical protein